jgi:Ca2+-binding EF-hand superfamily protein
MELFDYSKHWLMIVVSFFWVLTSAEPKPTWKSRILDKPLSEEVHFEGGEHNPEFDHDAFLGKEEAKAFDDMTPEESQKRLGLLFVQIDSNGDNRLTPDELRNWMKHVQNEYIVSDTEKQWTDIKPYDAPFMTWGEYVNYTYGSDKDEEEMSSISRDERRWQLADTDGDMVLTKDEYTNFLHPEEAGHMKESVIQETLDEVDKDNDGFVSLEEYMNDVTDANDEDDEDGVGWSKEDEDEFRNELDQDGDGRLDRDELYNWIVPGDYDHIAEETKHLFEEADENKDGFLSSKEVTDNYELFVGSQATDYGNVLRHQEL